MAVLDVHVHQLAADTPVCPRLGREVPGGGARRDRRPHARVRGRARCRQHPSVRSARCRIPYPVAVDSDYAVWDAFDNRYWPAAYYADAEGSIQQPPVRRGPLRRAGARDPAAPARVRPRRGRPRPRHGRRPGRRGSGRLEHARVRRDLRRLRTRRGLRLTRATGRRLGPRLHHPRFARARTLGARRKLDDRPRGRPLERARRQDRDAVPRQGLSTS